MSRPPVRALLLLLGALLALPGPVAAADERVRAGSVLREVDGRLVFDPCDAVDALALDDATPDQALTQLFAGADAAGTTTEWHVDLRGREHGGTFTATAIERAAREAAVCKQMRRQPAVFRALGHEPDWSLLANRDQVRVRSLATGLDARFRYARFARDANSGRRVFDVNAAAGHLRVTLLPEPCFDTLADAVYSHRAVVIFNGRVYRGCGFAGTLEE